MTIPVTMESVVRPSYLSFFGAFAEVERRSPRVIEMYGGWVVLNFGTHTDNIRRDTILSFLPSANGIIVPYHNVGNDRIDTTVTVAPAVAEPDEANSLFGVDEAIVELVTQSHLPGDPPCLVLQTKVAVREAILIRFTYHVTVKSPADREIPDHISIPGQQPRVL